MQLFWNQALTRALSEIFFLGWIDERVLLIQGEEVHLQVLRNGWTRRTLRPPQGFDIQCIEKAFLLSGHLDIRFSRRENHSNPRREASAEGSRCFGSDAGALSVLSSDGTAPSPSLGGVCPLPS
ncbi:Storkhead-box protein 1 [Liparis tanakae]|uniref:Storkhead-box protein 1 n=1 Tax=Liparis tanakae TaxID=230148 RepID=A0A4Z2JHK2_9TELE|nr:Storkhead-box protein 1 [Liparis tanakae]